MHTAAALDALDKMVAARVVGGVDKVKAGLVDGNGVKRGEDADILHARVLRHGAAVAVDRHILHHVDVGELAVEILHDGGCRVRHGFKKRDLVGGPHLLGLARTVDVGLARARAAADGELLQRAAEAAHRVALEVREHEHGVVIGHVPADKILLDALAVRNGKLDVRTLGVENVHIEELAPAVLDHRAAVGLGRVALAGIGRVALDDGAVHRFDHRLPEFRGQKVLIARLAGVDLDGDPAGKLPAKRPVELHDLLGCDIFGKINLCLHLAFLLCHAGAPAHDAMNGARPKLNSYSISRMCRRCK